MSTRTTKWVVMVGVIVLAVVVGLAFRADAKRPRKPTLRQEIAALKAEIAQLKNQDAYQGRLLANGRPDVVPGPGGLCADPCAADSDGDGTNDCEDPCPCDPSTTDGDGDGVADCADPCPDDATDACIDPCRRDSDGDGVDDCADVCPYDASGAVDADEDGIPDCVDPCPADKANGCGGPCGFDSDGDVLPDGVDPCPFGENDPTKPCVPLPPLPGVVPGGPVASGSSVAR